MEGNKKTPVVSVNVDLCQRLLDSFLSIGSTGKIDEEICPSMESNSPSSQIFVQTVSHPLAPMRYKTQNTDSHGEHRSPLSRFTSATLYPNDLLDSQLPPISFCAPMFRVDLQHGAKPPVPHANLELTKATENSAAQGSIELSDNASLKHFTQHNLGSEPALGPSMASASEKPQTVMASSVDDVGNVQGYSPRMELRAIDATADRSFSTSQRIAVEISPQKDESKPDLPPYRLRSVESVSAVSSEKSLSSAVSFKPQLLYPLSPQPRLGDSFQPPTSEKSSTSYLPPPKPIPPSLTNSAILSSSKFSVENSSHDVFKETLPKKQRSTPPDLESWPKSLRWLPSLSHTYTLLWENTEQQTMHRNIAFHRLYTASFTSPFCALLGILFLFLGGLLLLFNNQCIEYTVRYASNKGNEPFQIEINERMSPRIYVYYELDNFYGNTRQYAKDAPGFIYAETSCSALETTKEAFDLRTINSSLTLPSLAVNLLNNQTIQPSSSEVYPCGLSSLSIFNDAFELYKGDSTSSSQLIPISLPTEVSMWDLIRFLHPSNTYQGKEPWLFTHAFSYRIWMHSPFTALFRRRYGTIEQALEPGTYTMRFIRNLWPSEEWKSSKAITFATLSPVGSRATFLCYLLLATGGFCFFFAILTYILEKFCPIYVGKSFFYTDLPELKER